MGIVIDCSGGDLCGLGLIAVYLYRQTLGIPSF